MIVAGCDVGSLSAKAVVMRDGDILSSHVIFAKPEPEESAREVMEAAVEKAGISMSEIAYCVGTGYGRNSIPFAHAVESEIACHGRGARWFLPQVRMVIDVGGQDAKAIRLDPDGNVIRYAYNDKCASGTGRFLEVMAGALGVALEDMGAISLRSKSPVTISNSASSSPRPRSSLSSTMGGTCRTLYPASTGPWLTGSHPLRKGSNSKRRSP